LDKEIKRNKKIILGLSLLVCALAVLIGFIFWVKLTVAAPHSGNGSEKYFVITSGQGLDAIATNLKNESLISNRFVFTLYLKYKGQSGKIKAGEYKIPDNISMVKVSEIITGGKIVTSKITIPEGWSLQKIAERVAANTVVTASEFTEAAKMKPAYTKFAFLNGLAAGDSLEGFLYPDTYVLSAKPTADEIVERMLENFDKKFSDKYQQKLKTSGMTMKEVVTLSSIVEREVAKADDRRLVASVFLNRLNIGMPLESCATIQYVLGVSKKQFTYAETETPSPYNTYINPGLPPGPIGNPSIDSIDAVLFPEKSDFLFFLSSNGVTYFSKTLEEHNAKKLKYLN
jgi:UPF0755 protein